MSDPYLTVGMILCTKNSQKYSNAIVVQTEPSILILTDFGNMFEVSLPRLLEMYEPSVAWMRDHLNLPSIPISDRIDTQLRLLEKAKWYLNGT